MELSRPEYPALLTSLQPDQAVNILTDRVSQITYVNTSIADFLQERRRIEERYASDLRKLARRPQEGAAVLGIFSMPWQRIVSGTENLAQSHETLASKIETDVETPLRQYASKNREMQAITTTQGNLMSIAKEVSKAKDKVERATARGGKKVEDASSSAEDAVKSWDTQAAYVFEQLQALDETRLNHLRDVLTQFQTHEVDQIERNRTSAESCLNALLNVETADEIKTFAAKVSQGRGLSTRRQSLATGDQRPASSGIVPPAPPPPRNHQNKDQLPPLPDTAPHKSKMSGLKRLGTVMGRRKSAAPPPPQSSSEKKKEKSRSFAPFRRGDSSRSFQDLEETGRDLQPTTSQNDITPPPIPAATISEEHEASGNTRSTGPNGVEVPHSTSEELPAPLAASATAPSDQQNTASAYTSVSAGGYQNNPFYSSTTPAATELEDSSRNLTIRDQPIQEDAGAAQLAMDNVASQLRLQAQSTSVRRTQGSVRGRRDVRNTVFIPGNQEILGPSAVPNGGVASSATGFIPGAGVTSPIATPMISKLQDIHDQSNTPTLAPTTQDLSLASDALSVHSAQSAALVIPHPELHEPGLNASIVETVNTWFSDTGVTKSFVVGEIAFAQISTPTSGSPESEVIRIQNFQVLEKVAVNPTFVTAYKSTTTSDEEQAGSYNVALSAIRRPSPTVGLKYQLHLDEANLSQYSPVILSPAWKIEEGQASIIVLYSLNPNFVLPGGATGDEVILKNVAISVSLDVKEEAAGKPTSAQMMPTQGASFRRKAGAVIWRLSELKANPKQERLLVRFMVEGGVARKGSVELKFELPNATAGGLGVEKLSNVSAAADNDPFADDPERKSGEEGTWQSVPTKNMLATGRYTAV